VLDKPKRRKREKEADFSKVFTFFIIRLSIKKIGY
jgi:hypothetical protein